MIRVKFTKVCKYYVPVFYYTKMHLLVISAKRYKIIKRNMDGYKKK